MVTVKNLSVTIKTQVILNNISCSLLPGRVTGFIGQSGAGKTTLLKAISGLIPLQSGSIELDNQILLSLNNYERAQKVGYLFQNFNLFPHMTALENCMDPLLIHGIPYDQAQQQSLLLLEKMNMGHHAQKYPSELSGGQQQRVALARMLALKPSVILLDEPTASLDAKNKDVLASMLRILADEGLTIGLSTHDPAFAQKIVDDIYYIQAGNIIEFQTQKQRHASSLIQDFFSN